MITNQNIFNKKIPILEANEVGYGYLIENDAGYIDPKIKTPLITEAFEIKEGKPIRIPCILQKWGVKNKNGRIYPKDALVPQVEQYMNLVKDNSAVSEADHPDSSIISIHNISHKITDMWWGKGDKSHILFGIIELTVTPGFIKYGIASTIADKVLNYIVNHHIKIGISSRGVGTLKDVDGQHIVQPDYELIGFDLVSTPSTPGAFLFPGAKNIEQEIGENFEKKNDIYVPKEQNKMDKILDYFLKR